MDAHGPLEWIQRNRRRVERTQRASTLIEQLVRRAAQDGPLHEAAGVIAGRVDEEFRRHCRVGGLRSRTLLIHVDQASMVSAMQWRWSSQLSEVLRAARGGIKASRVRFAFSTTGVRIPTTNDE
ncbi:MAG: DUF721 domain-containing protein [Planctomycetes bacterium]|nr:DUF721 domain-containing protein [Planctomycetota bacterium]